MKLKYVGILISVTAIAIIASIALSLAAYKTNNTYAQSKPTVRLAQITPTPTPTPPTDKIACVRTALDKRENSVSSALDTFSGSVKNALAKRKNQLLDAWNMTASAERTEAINTAWSEFRTSRKNAAIIFNQQRSLAWKQFTAERSACGLPATGENPANDLIF